MTDVARQFADLRPTGGFRVILADPPWLFATRSDKGQGKGAVRHYPTMSTGEIAALPVDLLAADDCAMFIWVTWPLMPQWTRIINAWGFTFAGLAWEWIKFNPRTGKYAFGPGYGTRKNVEPCLLCTKGSPSLRAELPADMFGLGDVPQGVRSVRDFMQWWPAEAMRAERRQHSRKPDEQYERIETMFDGPYIELFSRADRPKWASWGNQQGKFNIEAMV